MYSIDSQYFNCVHNLLHFRVPCFYKGASIYLFPFAIDILLEKEKKNVEVQNLLMMAACDIDDP